MDAAYGATFGLLLAAGLARVLLGEAGAERYLADPLFWLKLGLVLLAALLSVRPTLALLRWRRRGRTDARFARPAREIGRLRHVLRAEAALLLAGPAPAALLARGYGS